MKSKTRKVLIGTGFTLEVASFFNAGVLFFFNLGFMALSMLLGVIVAYFVGREIGKDAVEAYKWGK